jgi:cytokinin dehydrogenase
MDTISRRAFLGYAVLAPWIGRAGAQMPADIPRLDGELVFDEAARVAIAVDQSNLYHNVPAAVLRPRSSGDIATVVEYANRHQLKVAIKGRGHSQYGQTQAANGIVIDSGILNAAKIAGADSLDLQPGAYWTTAAMLPLRQGLVPQVLPASCLALSVGGTLSAGGIGSNSYRDGAQVDTVTELDVVTGDGQLVTCSADRESELFEMTLAGMGQCAIIVRARVPLERAPARVVIQDLVYADRDTYLADHLRVAGEGRFDGQRGVLTRGRDGKWSHMLEAVRFAYGASDADMGNALDGLRFDSAREPVRMDYTNFLLRFEAQIAQGLARPQERQFVTMWMPAPTTSEFLGYLTAKVGAFSQLSVLPLNTRRIARPLLRMPEAEQAFSVWLFQSTPSGDVAARSALAALNRDLFAKMVALGGKRYAPYCGVMSADDWAEHFGPAVWRRLRAAKRRFDPRNVLTPGTGMFA